MLYHKDSVQFLLERCNKGIDMDLTDQSGKTASMLAKESYCENTFESF